MNTFAEYENAALGTAIYPGQGSSLGLMYVALKGAGEAGEFAEHVGKAIRDDGFGDAELTDKRRTALIKEIGDQLWYCAAKAKELGTTLAEVAAGNIEKLSSRAARGTLGGSGDDR